MEPLRCIITGTITSMKYDVDFNEDDENGTVSIEISGFIDDYLSVAYFYASLEDAKNIKIGCVYKIHGKLGKPAGKQTTIIFEKAEKC